MIEKRCKTLLHIAFNEDEAELLKSLAIAENRSMSKIVKFAAKQYIYLNKPECPRKYRPFRPAKQFEDVEPIFIKDENENKDL